MTETPAEFAGAAFENTLRGKAAELRRELIRQTLEDSESYKKAYNAEMERLGGSPLSPNAELAWIDRVENEMFEWVEPAFARLLTPDPDAINPTIEALSRIGSMFGGSLDGAGNFVSAHPALARINDVRVDMGRWDGDLQRNFLDNFVTPVQAVAKHQAGVVEHVRKQLELHKLFYIGRRARALDLATKAIEAVKILNNQRDAGTYTWLTLVGISVGTAVATLASGGLAVVGGSLIIGSTLGQGLIHGDKDKSPTELGAPTAMEVAHRVCAALDRITADTIASEREAADVFRTIYGAFSGSRLDCIKRNVSGPLAVATPGLSTAKPSEITDGSFRPNR